MNSISGIDVVIVNYNSGRALEQCMASIMQTKDIHLTIIDNNSSDDSLHNITNPTDGFSLIKNQANKGFSKACNQGAQKGKSPYIAFVNPDCFVTGRQLMKLAEDLNSYQHASLIGCRVLNDNGTLQSASRRRPPTFWRVVFHLTRLTKLPFVKGININDSGVFDQVIEVEAVNGACVVVKRADFVQVGGFDELYPLHFEDLDLFASLIKLGKKIIYQSNSEVKHLKGHSIQSSEQIKLWKKQGLIRYFKKHRPRWEAVLISWMIRLK